MCSVWESGCIDFRRTPTLTDLACRDVYRGDVLSLQVLDRSDARFCTHSEPYAVISITDPNLEHPTLARSAFRHAVLPLSFFDLDLTAPRPRAGQVDVGFTEEMARQVAQFVTAQRREG